jgi:hypothetical protein
MTSVTLRFCVNEIVLLRVEAVVDKRAVDRHQIIVAPIGERLFTLLLIHYSST